MAEFWSNWGIIIVRGLNKNQQYTPLKFSIPVYTARYTGIPNKLLVATYDSTFVPQHLMFSTCLLKSSHQALIPFIVNLLFCEALTGALPCNVICSDNSQYYKLVCKYFSQHVEVFNFIQKGMIINFLCGHFV